MAVTPDDVRHVAGLARLGMPEAALVAYVEQLNGILGHVDVLQRVDTTGVGAVAPAGGLAPDTVSTVAPGPVHAMPLRDDVVAPVSLDRTLASFAPRMADGFFLVPRLATHEDAGDES